MHSHPQGRPCLPWCPERGPAGGRGLLPRNLLDVAVQLVVARPRPRSVCRHRDFHATLMYGPWVVHFLGVWQVGRGRLVVPPCVAGIVRMVAPSSWVDRVLDVLGDLFDLIVHRGL